ncbi:MAG: hypothetical protein EP330_31225 [Deltaproteobacteria bacterium]|nr:MAG: hypothetical protein EP330_31225 [Deltaproteobacteria bacterium]
MRSVLFLLLCVPGVAFAGTPTWDAIKSVSEWNSVSTRSHADGGEIAVSSATVAGIACFKGTASTTAAPSKLHAAATDIESTPRWSSAGVTEAETLAKNGSTIEYYQYLDVPGWTMASDRFWFLTGTTVKDGDNIEFHWKRLDKGGAHNARFTEVTTANPSAIEPPVNVGGWRFTVADGKTAVEYFICTDTGGAIPTVVQNAATKKTLPDTVGELIGEAKRR